MAKMERYVPDGTSEAEKDVTRSFNFSSGIVLFVFALLFMFTKETFGIRHGHQLDSFFLGVLGIVSLWASVTKIEVLVFVINVLSGIFLLSMTILVAIFQVLLHIESVMNFRLDFTFGDFIFHLAIGAAFIINAVQWRKRI